MRRILAFGRPHRTMLLCFLVLTVVAAVLAVATPLLATRVVDAIVGGDDPSVVYRLAALIAAIALLEAGLGLVTR